MNGMNGPVPKTPSLQSIHTATHVFHVGPIISWPFFGSNRGDLAHPEELNRGPWASSASYLASCAEREIQGVIRENEGSAAPHRLHLDPDEIRSSRHHRIRAVPGDESDESDEWDLEESEEEWEGPGDAMYRDYRRMQRSTFLVAHMSQREEQVRREMGTWMRVMEHLIKMEDDRPLGEGKEEFGLDCHDLSLENVFVDAKDNTIIVRLSLISPHHTQIPLTDLYNRLGINHHPPTLGLRSRPRLPPIQPLRKQTIPRGCCATPLRPRFCEP